jgi:hypothetical protein
MSCLKPGTLRFLNVATCALSRQRVNDLKYNQWFLDSDKYFDVFLKDVEMNDPARTGCVRARVRVEYRVISAGLVGLGIMLQR